MTIATVNTMKLKLNLVHIEFLLTFISPNSGLDTCKQTPHQRIDSGVRTQASVHNHTRIKSTMILTELIFKTIFISRPIKAKNKISSHKGRLCAALILKKGLYSSSNASKVGA